MRNGKFWFHGFEYFNGNGYVGNHTDIIPGDFHGETLSQRNPYGTDRSYVLNTK